MITRAKILICIGIINRLKPGPTKARHISRCFSMLNKLPRTKSTIMKAHAKAINIPIYDFKLKTVRVSELLGGAVLWK